MTAAPSAFLLRERALVEAAARHGPVLDLACGEGRHALEVARWGLPVLAVDRDPERLASLRASARARGAAVAAARVDLETGHGVPLRPGRCGVVLVFRYLHRPLADAIAGLLHPGGLLLYETFTTAQRALGWGPRRDAFLLDPGELPALFPGLVVQTYEEEVAGDPPAALARLAAWRP